MLESLQKRLREESLGLVLVASALLAVAVVSALYLQAEREGRSERNRAQGLSLTQLLSQVPLEQLAPQDARGGVLEVARRSQTNPDFAWALLVDLQGAPLASATAPGVLAPPAPLAEEPSAWMGERSIEVAGRQVVEFYAPVLAEGSRVAHLRVGFFEPELGIPLADASLLAMLALPVFLLAPLAYLLLQREVRPLTEASRRLDELAENRNLPSVEFQASGEMRAFADSLNRFMALAQERMRTLEGSQTNALAASRVVAFQRSRLEAVFETLPDAILLLDERGRVSLSNSKVGSLLGVDPECMREQRPADWCADLQLVEFLVRYEGTRMSRAEAFELTPSANPEQRLWVSAHPLSDGGDFAAGTVVVLRDVTAEALARQAQGEFVTHVAHELKSPLNVIAMYSESLLGKDGEREEFRLEACNVLSDEVERLSMLVSTLLSIARIETGALVLERQPVRLADMLSDALDTVSRGRRELLEFDLQVQKGLPTLQLDKELMRVAINNLLTNAIKYNREHGRVELSAEDVGDHIVIRVRDTGLGISSEDRERVFEKFYRSDDPVATARGGHGLGLPLAREIVALHAGELELTSEPGVGSEFSIRLRKSASLVSEVAS